MQAGAHHPAVAAFDIDVDATALEAALNRISRRLEQLATAPGAKAMLEASTRLPDLTTMKRDMDGLTGFLESLRDTIYVDINDFEIRERRKRFARLLIAVKTGLWKFLRFYTYRLWSQQNQINGLQLSSLDAVHGCYSAKIAQLEARITSLEALAAPRQPVQAPSESTQ